MKKQKLKNYLKLGILFFGISLILTNCHNDDIQFSQEKSTTFLKGLSHRSFSSIKNNPSVTQKANRFIKSKNEFNKIDADSITFTIDTTAVQVIETQAYISYTFKANMFNEVENQLNNYVLTIFNDETTNQLLVTYPILGENNDIAYDIDNAIAESIDGVLLYNAKGCLGLYDVDTWDPNGGTCIEYDCTAGGNHSPGDNCNGSESEQPYTICTGAWVSNCASGNGNGGYTGDDVILGGGGVSNTPNDEEEEEPPIAIVPYDETFGLRRECRKITNFLDNTENVAFKQKLLDLANPTNYNTNLDIEFEKAVSTFENTTALNETQGVSGDASAPIFDNPINTYKAFVHTHPNDANGTFSVFSYDDLIAISKIIANDKIDTGTFVAFLITKKGDSLTHYALTINNKSKFKDFFYFDNDSDFNFNTATQEQKDKRRNSFNESDPIRTKYYEHTTSPKISKNNGNREQMLTEFLNFMDEADIGVTLFETDANFDTFNKVKKSDFGVRRLPCNN